MMITKNLVTESAKWNSAPINCTVFFLVLLKLSCQNILCDKQLVAVPMNVSFVILKMKKKKKNYVCVYLKSAH